MNETMRRASVAVLISLSVGLGAAEKAGAEYPTPTGWWTWGAGGSVHFEVESFGLQGQGIYAMNEQLRLSPSVTLFFDETWLSFDGDVQYVFPMNEDNPVIYGFGGLQIATDFDFAEVGINLGAGIHTRLSEALGGEVELKYVISDLDGFVLSFGVLF